MADQKINKGGRYVVKAGVLKRVQFTKPPAGLRTRVRRAAKQAGAQAGTKLRAVTTPPTGKETDQ